MCRVPQLFFVAPTGAQQLYYLHPDVSFFKGNGFKTIGPCKAPSDNQMSSAREHVLQLMLTLVCSARRPRHARQLRCGRRESLSTDSFCRYFLHVQGRDSVAVRRERMRREAWSLAVFGGWSDRQIHFEMDTMPGRAGAVVCVIAPCCKFPTEWSRVKSTLSQALGEGA